LILVTNETGLGIIPADSMSRTFRDRAGWMNQRLAVLADRVVLLVAGIPLALKGTLS
jgi:adenosylcobinamide kinase/adenosylcobinamide-phosphate guanylyltransferase